jgi:hypothetical protein
MTSFPNVRAFAVSLLCAAASLTASAADDSANSKEESDYLPWEKGSLKIGGFVTFFDSDLSFGLNRRPGAKINTENVLGLDSTLTSFRVEGMYRPGKSKRNQVDFYYARFHRDGEARLSKDLSIDGVTYPVGATVESVFNFDMIRGSYTYAFLQNERVRVGAGLGVYAVPLKYGLNVTTAGGRSNVNGADTTLPLPSLALRAEFQVIPKLFLTASVNGMYLEVNDYTGWLADLDAGIEYRPIKHLGLGLGYSFTAVTVETKTSDSGYPGANFIGTVDVRFSGLLLYGKFSF